MYKIVIFAVLILIFLSNNALASNNAAFNDQILTTDNLNNYVDKSLLVWIDYYDNGVFKDPLNSRSDSYGRGMLAYAFIKRGVETSNQAWIDIGLSALNSQSLTNSKLPFDLLTIAKAYNYNQAYLTNDARWLNIKPTIESYLTNFKDYTDDHSSGLPYCYVDKNCYNNWKLIQALGLVYLAKTNLDNNFNNQTFDHLLNLIINNQKKFYIDNDNLIKLSDPPNNPLAYHSFSNYLVNKLSVELDNLNKDEVLNQEITELAKLMNNYSNKFINPDGELAYMGRSYKQAFSLSSSIYANLIQANNYFNDNQLNNLDNNLYLSNIQFNTLLAYGKNKGIINISPSLKFNSYKGTDNYATLAIYNGLVLMQILDAKDNLNNLEPLVEKSLIKINQNKSKSSSLFCDDELCIFKNRDFFLSLHIKTSAKDNRYQAGILEAFVYNKQLTDNKLKEDIENQFVLNNKTLTKITDIKKIANNKISLTLHFNNINRKAIISFKNNFDIKIKLNKKDKFSYNAYLDNIIKINNKTIINNLDSIFKFKDIKTKNIRTIKFNKKAKIRKLKIYSNAVSNKLTHYQYNFTNTKNLRIVFN